ncbi:MAG: spore cortex-lytic protein [Ruminococcaceae bacterium]|nr:spore cortex-lytic protein [Oscillospiraceae bacterium]
MPAIGYIQANAYTSRARLPVEDVAVSVVDDQGRLLGLRTTDSSGLTTPIRLEVPDLRESQSPGNGKPFVTVNLYARAENYEQVLARGIQVFADTTTMQELQLVPLPELPGSWNQVEVFDTPPQNL